MGAGLPDELVLTPPCELEGLRVTLTTSIGLAAATCTTIAFVPQIPIRFPVIASEAKQSRGGRSELWIASSPRWGSSQ